MVSLISLSTISCTKSIESKADKFVKDNYISNLKDPTSYEKIDTKITDTVYITGEIEVAKSELDLAKSTYSLDSLLGYDLSADYDRVSTSISRINSLNKELESRGPKSISYIILLHKYKALNGFGLKAPEQLIIWYYPSNDKFYITQ